MLFSNKQDLYEELNNNKNLAYKYIRDNIKDNTNDIIKMFRNVMKNPEKYNNLYYWFTPEINAVSKNEFTKYYYDIEMIYDKITKSFQPGLEDYFKRMPNFLKTFDKQVVDGCMYKILNSKDALQTCYNNMGVSLFQFLPDNLKPRFYENEFLQNPNTKQIMIEMLNNESQEVANNIINYLAKNNNICQIIKKQMHTDFVCDINLQDTPANVFFQKNDINGKIPIQGWKLHISADNIVDYYKVYLTLTEEINNGKNISLKFVNPDKFLSEEEAQIELSTKGSIPNRFAKEVTVYLNPNFNILELSDKAKRLLNENIHRHPTHDKYFGGRISGRYGQFCRFNQNSLLDGKGGNILDDRYGKCKPDFIKENTLEDILNINQKNQERFAKTGDYKAYIQSTLLGTEISNNDKYIFTEIIVDKNQRQNLIDKLGHSFCTAKGEQVPIFYMDIDNKTVAVTHIDYEKDFRNIAKYISKDLNINIIDNNINTLENKFVKDNMIKENKVAETRKLSNIELDNVR